MAEGRNGMRVKRYPRMSAFCSAVTLCCALGRDACVSAGLHGWAQVLLCATVIGLLLSVGLMSCRFVIDDAGVGVGFLMRMRRTDWAHVCTLGALCCNSRRMYLYGLYGETPDFLHMLHRAPRCGGWGFVVPLNRRLAAAVQTLCPFDVDLTPVPRRKRPRGMRLLWHQAALYALGMLPAAALALITGWLMLVRGARLDRAGEAIVLTLGAFGMCAAGLFLLYRVAAAFSVCPAYSEKGVCIGRGMYMPWEDVRFGYVHRVAQASGLFFLSAQLEEVTRRGAPPVVCLSMPDASTVVLAYLTYCPYAPQAMWS